MGNHLPLFCLFSSFYVQIIMNKCSIRISRSLDSNPDPLLLQLACDPSVNCATTTALSLRFCSEHLSINCSYNTENTCASSRKKALGGRLFLLTQCSKFFHWEIEKMSIVKTVQLTWSWWCCTRVRSTSSRSRPFQWSSCRTLGREFLRIICR